MNRCLVFLLLVASSASAQDVDFIGDRDDDLLSDRYETEADLEAESRQIDRRVTVDVTAGSMTPIATQNFPDEYPNGHQELWRFNIAPGVQFRLECSTIDVPRRDNGFTFFVRTPTQFYRVPRRGFIQTTSPISRDYVRREVIDDAEHTVWLWFIGSRRNNLGTGLNCVVKGEGDDDDTTVEPTTEDPATTAPPVGGLQCGINSMLTTQIVNGQFAPDGKYPWMIALFFGNSFICGGTIIDENRVLTAAHCVDGGTNAANLNVGYSCGGNELGNCNVVGVQSISVHPDWSPDTALCSSAVGGSDLAVLLLDNSIGPFNAATHNAICLPDQGDCPTLNTAAEIAGWGRIGGDAPISMVLKEADITINNNCCGGNPPTTVICGSEGPGDAPGRTCNGDSGSFMGAEVDGQFFQHGITSFGFMGCPDNDQMGFTEVCLFADWIADQFT